VLLMLARSKAWATRPFEIAQDRKFYLDDLKQLAYHFIGFALHERCPFRKSAGEDGS
jgi:hypothetical protein